MELIKLVWDIFKISWDMFKTLGPNSYRQFKLRRSIWPNLVRRGAKSVGTPAEEIEDLLQAFDNPSFFITKTQHPVLNDIRHLIWQAHQKLDELRLLAVAEHDVDEDDRCWSLHQIGQRAGPYTLPILSSIADSLNTPISVKKAAQRAYLEITRRFENNVTSINQSNGMANTRR